MREPRSIELRHLRTFMVVAETQNFTRAAERLGLSQPSVSQQVKELETALGAELFVRLGPRVRLTPAGRTFQDRSALVFEKLTEACQAVTDVEGLLGGHLHVGVIPPLTVPWVPRTLAALNAAHPQLTVSVHERSSGDVEVDLESGRCHVGVGILSRASPNLTYEPLRNDAIRLVVRAEHPLARRGRADRTDLLKQRLVLLPETFLLRQITEAAFRRARLVPRPPCEVDSIDAVLATASRANLGALLPAVVLEEREHLGLASVPIDGFDAPLEFGLMWPGSGSPPAAAAAFADALREVTDGR